MYNVAYLCACYRGTRDQAMQLAHWLRDEVDLSYLNLPDINAMLKMADYRDLDKHFPAWRILQPPAACFADVFATSEGIDILEQIKILREVCLFW